MSHERWRQVDELLQSALERAPGERSAFLERACGGDDALRREVESLILSADEAGSFIERPAVESGAGVLAGERESLAAGRVLGNYKIIRQLGAGGMGEVYLVSDTRTGRAAALKVLPDHFTSDEQRVGRFRREAQAVLALNHPNVVTVYEIGQDEGLHYLVTEFIEGETLRSRLARAGRLEIGEALDVGVQVAAALAYAHERGIVHRDVKPENVMLRPDGYAKVLDFGIAKLTRRGASGGAADAGGEAPTRLKVSTSPGMVMGTAHYMSPEQARGLEVDERTDIWSLGVVLYEMVTGRKPFDGGTASDIISVILQRDPAPLSAHAPNPPAELGRIVSKALDKKKDERYQTAKDLHADLRRFRRQYEHEEEVSRSNAPESAAGLPGDLSRATVAPESAARTGGGAQHTTSSAEYIVTEIKKHKLGALGALVALVVFVSVLGGWLYKTFRGAPDPSSKNVGANADAPAAQIRIAPFNVNGAVEAATISPDGKYVAYALKDEVKSEMSLWVRHLPTASDVQIIPPSKDGYGALVFSPDSNYIYYRLFLNNQRPVSLCKIPVVGGTPKRLIAEFYASRLSFSPDGARMTFIREERGTGVAQLVVSSEDGSDERVVVSRRGDTEWLDGSPAWSPDGKTIAFAAGSYAGGFHNSLMAVRLEDGVEQPLGTTTWYKVETLFWLPDGSGLIAAAEESQNSPWQIWRVSYPDGSARRLTSDLNSYLLRGLTRDGATLLAFQEKQFSDIWTTAPSPGADPKQLTFTKTDGYWGLTWAPDGRIVFAASDGEHLSLWVMNADGSARTQLTGGAKDWSPSVSPDGRHVVFTSSRSGPPNIWRVDMDGRNLRQLTSHDSEDNRARYTGDGKWVTFNSFRTGKTTIWRMPAEGGEAVQISDRGCYVPEPSPDGRFVACIDREPSPGGSTTRVLVLPVEGGEPPRVVDLPPVSFPLLRWTPDSRSLMFVQRRDGAENVWLMPLEGGRATQLTGFKPAPGATGPYFALSRDGRTLAVARPTLTSDLVLITNFK